MVLKFYGPEIKQEITKRQIIYKKNIKEKNKEETNRLKTVLKKQINKIRIKIKKQKIKYYNKFTNKDTNYWKEIKIISNTKSENKLQKKGCEMINENFFKVWEGKKQPDISEFIDKKEEKQSDKNNKNKNSNNNKNLTQRITEEEVKKQLEKLITNSAAGPDNINSKLLKAASEELTPIITHLFNLSITQSYVPAKWKEANIIPVPKTTKPIEPSDFRPISLTSCMCKVLERIICKKIIHLTQEIWQNNQQFGFLPGKNTTDAVIQVIDDWGNAIDQNKSIQAVFFDFSKAFDLVDHMILLKKLTKMNIPKWIVSWIAAYLQNRKQRVITQKHKTEWKNVEAGVIQGSVVGPTLFILFISDINEYLPVNIKAPKYADDILTYCIYKKTIGKQHPRSS